MSAVDSECAWMITATMARPIAISYEITWAAERSEPSSGYGEPDDQPDSRMP